MLLLQLQLLSEPYLPLLLVDQFCSNGFVLLMQFYRNETSVDHYFHELAGGLKI
jgi:hypothetical protein